jgi:hypothetical protein
MDRGITKTAFMQYPVQKNGRRVGWEVKLVISSGAPIFKRRQGAGVFSENTSFISETNRNNNSPDQTGGTDPVN